MNLDQETFSKTIKDFGTFVMQVLSGANEDQKKSLKVNLQVFQNLCDSFEMLNTNESKENGSQNEHSENLNSNECTEKVRSDNKLLEEGNKSSKSINCSSKNQVPSNSENFNSEVDKTSIDIMHEPDNSRVTKEKMKKEEDDDIFEIIHIEKEHVEEETNANKGNVDSSPNNDDSKHSEIKCQYVKKAISETNVGKRPSASKNEADSDKKKVKYDSNRKVELPDEIWMKIMSYLKSIELFQNFSLVSKLFYNIHRSAVKYFEMKCVSNKKDYQKAIKVLLQCKSVKMFKIELSDRRYSNLKMKYMNEIIKQVLVSFPNLKTLMVYPTHKYTNPEFDVETIGTFGKKLEHLVIDTYISCKNFMSNLHELKTLKPKNLNSSKDIISLSENCPKLECIHFYLSDFGRRELDENQNAAFDEFFSKRAPTLKEVSFEYASNDQIFRCISLGHNMERFKAFKCKITNFGLNCISEFANLKELLLHDIKPYTIGEKIQMKNRGLHDKHLPTNYEALIAFSRNMNKNHLKCLVFSECEGFDTSVLKELSMQHFPKLETLIISDQSANIVKPGEIIKELIKNCPRLKDIQLKGGFANTSRHSLLAIAKDFNIPIKIHNSLGCISFSKNYLLQTYSKKFGYECNCKA